ncbi:MAG: dihydrolipoyl dehydrogenase [Elusimicrobia bacterium]|nr:dihydrolipoyl dehydrogenase [Elusimicrobiota bacterium]
MAENNIFDLIILGAGPAGYSAAIRSAQTGKKVLLVEKEKFGGTCLNWGCIPTKFLWESVNLAKKIRKAGNFGFSAEIKDYSFELIQKKNEKNIEILSKGLKNLIESYKIETKNGSAKFIGGKKIEISSIDGKKEEIEFKKLIIACGSLPKDLPNLKIDHNKVIDSRDALQLKEIPKSLLIIGGGAIGVEMATIFSYFGSEVSIIEKEPNILPGEDVELSEEIKKNLVRSGVSVNTGAVFSDDLRGKFEKIILVVGRKPNIDQLFLEKEGIVYTPNGISVNEYLETSVKGIYAAGDVNGKAYFAYTAIADGLISAENAFVEKNKTEYSNVPKVVFSDPPCASIGNIPEDLKEKIVYGKFPFTANSRALIEGERSGWVKVSVNKKTNEILSGQIIGANADELIQLLSIAIRNKLKVDDLRRELFFHPGLSEALLCALEDSINKCVELPKKQ